MAEAASAMPNASEIQVSRNGLTELYRPPDDKSVAAHVIFIHGLFGSPDKTWTKDASGRTAMKDDDGGVLRRSVFWPRELLPKIVPRTTVHTWGYDADIDGFMQPASRNSLYQHAGNLLTDLCDLRDTFEDKTIPFIFIAHSLGGLVVKDALNRSCGEIGTRIKDIAPHTFAICFLGTPHRGSKLAKSGRRAIALKMLASSRQPNVKLMQALQQNSEILDRIGSSFFQTVDKYGFQIASFCEETEIRLFSIISLFIVEPDSAKIGHSKEETGTIPADHRNMAKFGSESDTGFSRVSKTVKRWVETSISSRPDKYFDCLQSLKIPEAGIRYQQVVKNHNRTFGWLFEKNTVQFIDWLRETKATGPAGRLFWITGKPGSGKSTIMKHAIRNSKTMDHLQASGVRGWHMIPFFFSDRGSEKQRIFQTMLYEILYQLLGQIKDSFSLVFPLYRRLGQMQKTTIPKWDIATLCEGISEVISKSTSKAGICLFMDALDEHSGHNENLCKFFWDLSSKSEGSISLKICLASRPGSVFRQQFRDCRSFAIHEHTKSDIRIYVADRLKEASKSIELQEMDTEDQTQEKHGIRQLAEDVTSNAQGVFIWVRLVIDELCQGLTDGTPIPMLSETLKSIPHELENLYKRALSKVRSEYATEAHLILHMVLSSLSQLQTKKLLDSASWLLGHEVCFQPPEAQASRLASRTGGLLEVVNSDRSSVVQFIHQTAKEYIRNHGVYLNVRDVPMDSGTSLVKPSSPLHPMTEDEFQELKGPNMLLLCGVQRNSFSASIFPHLFAYAKEVDNKLPFLADKNKHLALDSLSSLLDDKGLWESFSAYNSLRSFTGGPSPVELAIAANWINMITEYFSWRGIMDKAVTLATLGPFILDNCTDRRKMVQALIYGHRRGGQSRRDPLKLNELQPHFPRTDGVGISRFPPPPRGLRSLPPFPWIEEPDRRRMLESVGAVGYDVKGHITFLEMLVLIRRHPFVSEAERIEFARLLLQTNTHLLTTDDAGFTLRCDDDRPIYFRSALSFCLHVGSVGWVDMFLENSKESIGASHEDRNSLIHCLASSRGFANPVLRAKFLQEVFGKDEKELRPIPDDEEEGLLGVGWPLVWLGSQCGIIGSPHINRGFCSSGDHRGAESHHSMEL